MIVLCSPVIVRFCVTDPPRETLRSDSNEMLVLFRSYSHSLVCDDVQFPWKCHWYNIGFKAKFYTSTLSSRYVVSDSYAYIDCTLSIYSHVSRMSTLANVRESHAQYSSGSNSFGTFIIIIITITMVHL